MDSKKLEKAVARFRKGERPFGFRRPVWFFIAADGESYPLKYVYAMAAEMDSLNTHTYIARRELTDLGYRIFKESNTEAKPQKSGDRQTPEKLSSQELQQVTAEYIWKAVQSLLGGAKAEEFGASVDYDLLVDGGVRLAPKQVFGLAASDALGLSVKPFHFTAGANTVCFQLLERAGYRIVAKGGHVEPLDLPPEQEELEWAEGAPKLVKHFRRERAPGLAHAKKAQFRNQHGRLFCESCQLEPSEKYGPYAEACIEVHHNAIHVAHMKPGQMTKLEQLQCLCANCHRVLHRQIAATLANRLA